MAKLKTTTTTTANTNMAVKISRVRQAVFRSFAKSASTWWRKRWLPDIRAIQLFECLAIAPAGLPPVDNLPTTLNSNFVIEIQAPMQVMGAHNNRTCLRMQVHEPLMQATDRLRIKPRIRFIQQ